MEELESNNKELLKKNSESSSKIEQLKSLIEKTMKKVTNSKG
jgi:hypothetical protein